MALGVGSCVRIKDIPKKPPGRICRIFTGEEFPYCVVFFFGGGTENETRRDADSLEEVDPCPVDWPIKEGHCVGHCQQAASAIRAKPRRVAKKSTRKKAVPKKKPTQKKAAPKKKRKRRG